MSHEAEHANVLLTLMTLDELIIALLEYYDDINMDTKQMVPLKLNSEYIQSLNGFSMRTPVRVKSL